ncbi:hypothetical protein C8F04DRAFT_1190581 [Mycena alexandri]|uniref:Uncharacterized protein n=1 Tax=Mycena alexandri TaxID=1745969 RepID=A0AAD6SEV6_9AGAR|nr:hypothetical protein C8F04DRAFT_1190581 [Mycena alexandri]
MFSCVVVRLPVSGSAEVINLTFVIYWPPLMTFCVDWSLNAEYSSIFPPHPHVQGNPAIPRVDLDDRLRPKMPAGKPWARRGRFPASGSPGNDRFFAGYIVRLRPVRAVETGPGCRTGFLMNSEAWHGATSKMQPKRRGARTGILCMGIEPKPTKRMRGISLKNGTCPAARGFSSNSNVSGKIGHSQGFQMPGNGLCEPRVNPGNGGVPPLENGGMGRWVTAAGREMGSGGAEVGRWGAQRCGGGRTGAVDAEVGTQLGAQLGAQRGGRSPRRKGRCRWRGAIAVLGSGGVRWVGAVDAEVGSDGVEWATWRGDGGLDVSASFGVMLAECGAEGAEVGSLVRWVGRWGGWAVLVGRDAVEGDKNG